MEFLLWVCRAVHLVSVVVWLGGLVFLNAVWRPIVEHRGAIVTQLNVDTVMRFQPFVWSSLWPVLVTGLLLMVLSPRFVWFESATWWVRLLMVKQLSFAALAFFAWQMMKVLRQLERTRQTNVEEFTGWWLAYSKLVKRSIVAGNVALLCGAAMMVV